MPPGILDEATRISTPLALSGLFAVIVFFILKQIIAKDIFPAFTRSSSFKILHVIINRLFILALVAMTLGFVGYVLPEILSKNSHPPPPTLTSSEVSERFGVMYYNIGGHAIAYLAKGKIDSTWQKHLGGQPFIVPNEVFQELQSLIRNFSRRPYATRVNVKSRDSAGTSLDSKDITKDIKGSNSGLHFLLDSSLVSFGALTVLPPMDVISSLESDTSWNLSCPYTGSSVLENGAIQAGSIEFWKFANRDDLSLFSERGPSVVALQKYITKDYMPAHFSIITLRYYGCGDAWEIGLTHRDAMLRVALVENISQKPIRIDNFLVKENRSNPLRTRQQDREVLNEQAAEPRLLFPLQMLIPGEKLLIPLEICFKYDFEDLDRTETSFAPCQAPDDLAAIDDLPYVLIEGRELDSISSHALRRLLSKGTRDPMMGEEFIFGPSMSIDSIQVDSIICPFREYDPELFVMKSGLDVGSCPYVYTYSSDANDWLSEGRILYGNDSKNREGEHVIKLNRFTGKIIIKEHEPEISFIDCLYIVQVCPSGEQKFILPANELVRFKDNLYLVLKQGEQAEIQFEPPPDFASCEFFLHSHGYYDTGL